MKAVRALAHMTPEARAVLERLAAELEVIALKGVPLSVADEVFSWRTLLAASQILSEMDTAAMGDDVVSRLRAAIDNLEALAPDGEGRTWIN